MDRYTRTFECFVCNSKVKIRAPDVTAVEAELGEARARVTELEVELPPELREADAHDVTRR
jgi:hypothetical protein